MYPYIKCPTCGKTIGHLFRLFQEVRAIKNQSPEEDKDLLDIYEALHVHNYCCKKCLSTARIFNEFLYE